MTQDKADILTDAERKAIEVACQDLRHTEEAATLRSLLERLRLSARSDFPEPDNQAIQENSQPTAWAMPDRVLVDPPQGWRYGFPKVWDRRENPDCREWLIENGYPRSLAEAGLPCTFTEVPGNDP